MASRNPSYIYQSPHGIWYFQVWVPERFRATIGAKKLIRKSLGTRNRRHALRLARELWLEMDRESYDEDRIDQEAAEDERLYFRGKSIAAKLKADGVDTNNPYEVSRLIEELPDYDMRALAFYENTLADLKQQQESKSTPVPAAPAHPPGSNVPTLPVTPLEPSTGIKPSELRLSDIVEKWIHHNTEVVDAEKKWSLNTIRKYRSDITVFVNMVDNPLAHELKDEMVRDLYGDELPKMPKGIGNKKRYHVERKPVIGDDGNPVFYANGKPKTEPVWKPIDEILEIAKKTHDDKYDKKTVANSAVTVSNFLKWAGKKKYLQPGLHIVLEDLANSATTKKPTGTLFTDDDMKLLFENDAYQKGLLFKIPYRHWIPLLLLYTGARLGEVSQLRVKDIEKVKGIWAIKIRFYDESSTVKGEKDPSYVRIVPLHKELEKLGFRKFVEQMKAKSETHLFPVLSPAEGSNSWGSDASKWFNGETVNKIRKHGYLEQCGISKVDDKGKKKNFHSFRYAWITHAKREKLDHDMRRELCGHASDKKPDVHMNYEDEYELADRKKAINKISYNIDVDAIMKWH